MNQPNQAVSPAILLSTISFSRFGCFGLDLDFGCIARLIFDTGGFASDGTETLSVWVDVSVMEVEVVVEVNEAAAVIEAADTLGAKRVLGGFLDGEGGSDAKVCIVERGLFFDLVVGFTRVEEETDLARGLRAEDMDLGLAFSDEGSALVISTSSVSEASCGVMRAFLVVLDRVRTLLWLAPSESESESSESASAALRARLREADPRGSWHLSRAQEVSLSSWIVESARNRARLRSVVCMPS